MMASVALFCNVLSAGTGETNDVSPGKLDPVAVRDDYATRRDQLLSITLGASAGQLSDSTVEAPRTGEQRINIYGGYSAMLLRLGLHVKEANAVIREVAEWFERPHVRGRDLQGEVDFTALELARLYVALKDSPNLEESTREKIRQFFLTQNYASMYHSENHKLVFTTARYLMASELPQETFAAYGMSGAELQVDDAAYLKEFIRYRARTGWGEFDSSGYQALVIKGLLTLYDFAPDPELAALSGAMVNLILADMAVDTESGLYGGARGRVAESDVLRHGQGPLEELQYLYFGIGDYEPGSGKMRLVGQERLSTWETMNEALFSSFRPMDVVLAIALERDLPYENRERKHLHNMEDVLPVEPLEGSIRKLTYLANGYLLGAIQWQDPYPAMTGGGERYAKHQQLEWDFSVTASPGARIFTHHPGNSGLHTYWRGSDYRNTVQTFQQKNAVLATWDIPGSSRYKYIHAYLPAKEFDEIREDAGWVFARKGDVLAAVYLHGGYEWTKTGPYAYMELTSPGLKKASVFECGHLNDFGSFDEFCARIVKNKVTFDPQTLELSYDSARNGLIVIRPDGTRMVNGQAVDLDYPTYGSPYLQSPWDSGIVAFRAGGMERVVDFNDEPFRFER
ncbi:hypothetical protein H5P28_07850 [Ruficoccus amylovorans]|uniref:Heparin-sulfate lyase N-terminal domain-containing protein n=1 Tax=Ruficoccus amylovorans TaxID=1804625 RepID=A0A842HCI0_9BACT|nr:hypothetical protein [Ruficoccus amylovorans]MBC2594173.1 hypothetical protein [Ruficoccus amylovorans]